MHMTDTVFMLLFLNRHGCINRSAYNFNYYYYLVIALVYGLFGFPSRHPDILLSRQFPVSLQDILTSSSIDD